MKKNRCYEVVFKIYLIPTESNPLKLILENHVIKFIKSRFVSSSVSFLYICTIVWSLLIQNNLPCRSTTVEWYVCGVLPDLCTKLCMLRCVCFKKIKSSFILPPNLTSSEVFCPLLKLMFWANRWLQYKENPFLYESELIFRL